MKLVKNIFFILLFAICFSQTVFASEISENFIINSNSEITHTQTIFDTEKETHTFIVSSSNCKLSLLSIRKKIDFSNPNLLAQNFSFNFNQNQNSQLNISTNKDISIQKLFLSELSPHAP